MKIKEILLLHHSHFDVGYTHTQPIVWELQREFIDLALQLLDDTKDFDLPARPKWTIEVTEQIMHWLKTASDKDLERFKAYAAEGRIGISGMKYNTTPLANNESINRQLEDIGYLKELFGIEIKSVNQHDVNGMPWGAIDPMVDAGIELFIMAVNQHLGGKTLKRPSIFRWQAASGKEMFVMNGAHYTMFDQLFYTWENSLDRMEEGLAEYYQHLEKVGYEEDFIYLTTAAAPVCWDNSPPTIDVPKLVQQWNREKREPFIRYITPNELLERIKQKPIEEYSLYKGDWTDYWNFGAASTAVETKINNNAKLKARKSDFINSLILENDKTYNRLDKELWDNITLFDEHTWGSYNSMDDGCEYTRIQANFKDHYAFKAQEIAEYLLINRLEILSGNPENFDFQDGVMLVNPTGVEKEEYIRIPDWWFEEGKRRRTSRYGWQNRVEQIEAAPKYGPVKVAPYSASKISLKDIKKTEKLSGLKTGELVIENEGRTLNILDTVKEEFVTKYIESDYYRIEFNPDNCRITRVYDKENNWEIIDNESEFTFFQFVRERTDELFRTDRRSYYARQLEKEKFDDSCWNTDWHRVREKATKALGYEIIESDTSIELKLNFEAPGCKSLTQSFILNGNKRNIEIQLEIDKEDVKTPESVYFVTPMNLEEGWKAKFDTASIPTQLDSEQLAGSSRDWVTVDNYAAMYDENRCAVLFAADAPMIQFGGINFGNRSKEIERKKNPLFTAWPLNNYWDTNFRPSQPGMIRLKYYFNTYKEYNASRIFDDAEDCNYPIEHYPLLKEDNFIEQCLFEISSNELKVLHTRVKDGALIIRLLNLAEDKNDFTIKMNSEIEAAYFTNAFNEKSDELKVEKNEVSVELNYREVKSIIVQ